MTVRPEIDRGTCIACGECAHVCAAHAIALHPEGAPSVPPVMIDRDQCISDYPAAAKRLVDMKPQHSFFVGIDSDGCAFDTMEIKHKECFIPNIIKYWDLQAVSKYAREAAEFVNLYSKWRGINRWPALVMVFDLLAERPEVQSRATCNIPEAPEGARVDQDGAAAGQPGPEGPGGSRPATPSWTQALAWSEAVNAAIAEMVHDVPPFPYVRESLEKLQGNGRHHRRLGDARRGAGARVGGARHRPLRPRHRRAGDGHQEGAPAMRRRASTRPTTS